MGAFIRERLPDAVEFFESEGVHLVGRGRWKTGPCHFHDGSDSLRVNTESGGWCCMACGEKGGDVLAYAMQRHGWHFVQAARALGAYDEDGGPPNGSLKPATLRATLPARDAMQLVAFELILAVVVISDIRRGLIPSDSDWLRFIKCAGRIEVLAAEYRT